MALYPIVFEPIFKERVWGGRTLERLYGKHLPAAVPIGESWEISDRPGDVSIIGNGPFAGRTLRWLMDEHGVEVLGASAPAPGHRFPLLCKILDAREKLSLQVHPPPRSSGQLGEPKTEMWYIAGADPGAELFVGLRHGLGRDAFERAIREGRVADCFHRVSVRTDDAMFLPSGRVHAIGAGLVIFEIQQNSDTTFRVYDWDRVGLDGKPRELHIEQSLASIDFSDVAPALVARGAREDEAFSRRPLVRDPLFNIDLVESDRQSVASVDPGRARVIAVVRGQVLVDGGGVEIRLGPGQFCLLPASVAQARLASERDSAYLLVEAG
jgi:mannose-6-phosphate isomerase